MLVDIFNVIYYVGDIVIFILVIHIFYNRFILFFRIFLWKMKLCLYGLYIVVVFFEWVKIKIIF